MTKLTLTTADEIDQQMKVCYDATRCIKEARCLRMRIIKSVIFALTACFVIIGCTTSKYVSSGVPIRENYSFGYIEHLMDYGGSPQLYSMDLEIYQLIGQTGIKMLGEGEIEKLSDSEKQHLLAIKYAVSSSSLESVVTISFFDYITKRPLLNCTGASSWGFPSIDIPGAKKNALYQMELALRY